MTSLLHERRARLALGAHQVLLLLMTIWLTAAEKRVCGGPYKGPFGSFQSPNYPRSYLSSSHCTWELEAQEPNRILLQSRFFQTEHCDYCTCDRVLYYSILPNEETHLHDGEGYCGTYNPFNITSITNRLRVEFLTDSANSYTGFSFDYTIVCGGHPWDYKCCKDGDDVYYNGCDVDQSSQGQNSLTPAGTRENDIRARIANSTTINNALVSSQLAYVNSVLDPVDPDSLEYLLDYYEEDELKDFDFDPAVLTKNLIDISRSQNDTTLQFQKDIKDLIVLHHRSINLKPGEKPDERLRVLKEKYNVTPVPPSPKYLTMKRLEIMFPHYAIIAGSSKSSDIGDNRSNGSEALKGFADSNFSARPNLLQSPEFGGLIPHARAMKDSTRNGIIALHLRALTYSPNEALFSRDGVPFRTQSLMLKWRIEKSLLSDARRFRLLQNYGIITEDGGLRKYAEKAYNEIPVDFMGSIFWRFLK